MEPKLSSSSTSLNGTIISLKEFKFECGFTIPLHQISWLFPDKILRVGDRLTIKVKPVKVIKHEHEFKCNCGEIRSLK